jgi:hypothetical protein
MLKKLKQSLESASRKRKLKKMKEDLEKFDPKPYRRPAKKTIPKS